MKHLQNDIAVVPIVLHFGPLIRIENVFEDQRVQSVTLPEPFNRLDIIDAIDIDPGDGGLIFEDETLLNGFNFLLLDMGLIIIKDGNLCPVAFSSLRCARGFLAEDPPSSNSLS